MSRKPMVRPGGRSARVQASVHAAVHELEAEVGREALTVPLVATRAGVTPSTIYRRWGTGRAYIRDALLGDPDGSNAGQCSAYAAEQIAVILDRAVGREETTPDAETVLDRVVAPMMYRILFRPDGLDTAYARQLVAGLVGSTDH